MHPWVPSFFGVLFGSKMLIPSQFLRTLSHLGTACHGSTQHAWWFGVSENAGAMGSGSSAHRLNQLTSEEAMMTDTKNMALYKRTGLIIWKDLRIHWERPHMTSLIPVVSQWSVNIIIIIQEILKKHLFCQAAAIAAGLTQESNADGWERVI